MSAFTRSFAVWHGARHPAKAHEVGATSERRTDNDLASTIALLIPILQSGEAQRSPALVAVLQQADSDELAELCKWNGIGDILKSSGISQGA